MLVGDPNKRITWKELFNYDFNYLNRNYQSKMNLSPKPNKSLRKSKSSSKISKASTTDSQGSMNSSSS